jgi:hypothetical protein
MVKYAEKLSKKDSNAFKDNFDKNFMGIIQGVSALKASGTFRR